jgi:hypothetical protein
MNKLGLFLLLISANVVADNRWLHVVTCGALTYVVSSATYWLTQSDHKAMAVGIAACLLAGRVKESFDPPTLERIRDMRSNYLGAVLGMGAWRATRSTPAEDNP